jgi:pSer/pThr/pTyr-binding forkhead associated (FHA) protein
MLSCPLCGGINTESGTFCQHCGADLANAAVLAPETSDDAASDDDVPVGSVTTATCAGCGSSNPIETNFCHDCGMPLGSEIMTQPARGGTGTRTVVPDTFETTKSAPAINARLVTVRRDGSDGSSHVVHSDQFDLGRTEGDLLFDDPHMAGRHARIVFRDGDFVILPLETRNGVYVRLRQPTELYDGDLFLLGKQVLRFEVPFEVEKNIRPAVEHGVMFFGTPVKPPWGRLRQLTAGGTTRDIYHLTRTEAVMGREQGDIVFGDDEFLSRRHAQIESRNNHVTLTDLASSNGTFVRLRGQHVLAAGELIRIGDELLRFEIG